MAPCNNVPRCRDAGLLFGADHVITSDVADPQAISTLFDTVIERFPALDTIFNNAGIMRNLDLNQRRDLHDVTREIDIDLSGPIRVVQQFLPHLKARPGALIVNVSSGLAFVPFPLSPVYSAAKAGVRAYTQCLRVQLASSSIAVVELAPPGVETPLFRGEFVEEMKNEKAMPVDRLVHACIAGIEAGKTEITPGVARALKLSRRLAPTFIFGRMAKDGEACGTVISSPLSASAEGGRGPPI